METDDQEVPLLTRSISAPLSMIVQDNWKIDWKTPHGYYMEEIEAKCPLLIMDPDGFHRQHVFASFFWYFVPIPKENYYSRKSRCSCMNYENHPKVALFSREKAIKQLWEFRQSPLAEFLMKVQGWNVQLTDEEQLQMHLWSESQLKQN